MTSSGGGERGSTQAAPLEISSSSEDEGESSRTSKPSKSQDQSPPPPPPNKPVPAFFKPKQSGASAPCEHVGRDGNGGDSEAPRPPAPKPPKLKAPASAPARVEISEPSY